MEHRYLRVETNQGIVFIKESYEKEKNRVSFFKKNSTMIDIDTDEPVKMIDNYIKYINLDKCLEYARIDVSNDEEIHFTPFNIGTLSEEQNNDRKEGLINSGISPMDLAYRVIKDGIPEAEAKEKVSKIVKEKIAEIRKRKEEELKRIQEEKEKYGWLVTFYNTFGDLFTEEEQKYHSYNNR